jgi:hypothetical protein
MPDARVGDFGVADDAGFVDVFREARRNVIGCHRCGYPYLNDR